MTQDPFANPGDQPTPPPTPGYGTPPPGYGPPPAYGAPPYGYPPQSAKTNVMAIVSLVGAFTCTPVGLICGIIALNQIKSSGEQGKGMAIAGVVISVLTIVGFVAVFALGAYVEGSFPETTSDFSSLARLRT